MKLAQLFCAFTKQWPWGRSSPALFAPAGPVRCDECDRTFVVGSCATCGAVHVIGSSTAPLTVSIPCCRLCKRSTEAPGPLRNWSTMLIGKGDRRGCERSAGAGKSDQH